MNASFALEILLAILLVACLVFCWRVERRLAQFRASRVELENAAREIVVAVTKADGAIRGLRATSAEAGALLQERIEEARALADEIAVLQSRNFDGLPRRAPRADGDGLWNR